MDTPEDKRSYYAGKAVTGLLANSTLAGPKDLQSLGTTMRLAKLAFGIADAMIEVEKETGKPSKTGAG